VTPPSESHEQQPPRWIVWRLDDNGNRFKVSEHASEVEARIVADEFERRGHKQLYVVEPATG